MGTTATTPVRELDRRTTDRFDVRLLWHSQTNRVFLAVDDQRHGSSFELEVKAANALDAFRHPFAYTVTDNDGDAWSLPPERGPANRDGTRQADD